MARKVSGGISQSGRVPLPTARHKKGGPTDVPKQIAALGVPQGSTTGLLGIIVEVGWRGARIKFFEVRKDNWMKSVEQTQRLGE